MTEASNRVSVQSGFSEFSFEHNDDELQISTPRSERPRSPTPTRSPLKFDGLIKENRELKLKVSEQNQFIERLKGEIEELQRALGKDTKKDPQKPDEKKPEVSEFDNSSNIVTQHVLVNEKALSSLSPPPRSASRAKTSPLRSEETPKPEPVIETADETIDEIQPTNDNDSTLNEEDVNKDTLTDIGEDLLRTPSENGDTRRSSSYSNPPEPNLASPEKSALAPNSYTSPYKGRIMNNSSPLRNPPRSASNHNFDSPVESPVEVLPETVSPEVKEIATPTAPTQQNLHNDSRTTIQGSPLPPAGLNKSTASPFVGMHDFSTPSSPLDSKYNPNEPTKSNLYDPYEGDFQHQQIYQKHNGFGGVYNGEGTPTQQQFPQQEAVEQDSTHKRFPSDVPLFVNPSDLSTVRTEIISTICGNFSKKSEDPVVIIAACDRKTGTEMWRFKKTLSKIVLLDTQIRPLINSFSLPPVPEKALFLSNAPVKVDIRRLRLKDYFSTLFTIPHIPLDAAYKIARFMSQDVVNLLDESNTDVLKDGYLLRRSKGLGNNWKARYCEVDGPFLNVFDYRGGPLLEILKLTGSQIGRQPDNVKHTDDKASYRHAFAVMEPKKNLKSTSFTKHIFCAETDLERDTWINVLVQFVEDSSAASTHSGDSSSIMSSQTAINQDIPSASPTSATLSPSRASIYTKNEDYDELEELVKESKRNKKRSFFPFSKKAFNEEMEAFKAQQQQPQGKPAQDGSSQDSSPQKSNIEKSLQSMDLLDQKVTEKVFHSEIIDSIKLSSHDLYGYQVPSIIYRCLTYLTASDAVIQEGLFRLNGSASLIKQLRESFDNNYDTDFNEMNPRPDINTIAGLLKLYLRELPSVVLTKEFYSEYRDAYNREKDPSKLSIEFREITKKLPVENYSLLYVLFKFLNEVIRHQDMNKMNLRNLCIVFSPTLNIASEVIVPFFVDFSCIFEGGYPVDNSQRETLDIHIPTF